MQYLSIDRIEDTIAVCEDDDRKRQEIPLAEICGHPQEGDVICRADGKWQIDDAETCKRRARILALQKKLFGE